MLGALYDIAVKNPKDLIIGNAQMVFHASTTQKKITALVLMILGVLYTLALYGLTGCFLGYSIAAFAGWANVPIVAKLGSLIETIGEKLLVASAVPIYGLGVALPKRIIAAFPAFFSFLSKKTETVCLWVFHNVTAPLWKHIAMPPLIAVGKAIRWTYLKCRKPIDWICYRCWTYMMKPVLRVTARVVLKILNNASRLFMETARVAGWIFEKILFPPLRLLWCGLYITGKTLGKYLLMPLWKVTSSVVRVIAKTISFVAMPILKLVGRMFAHILNRFVSLGTWALLRLEHLWNEILKTWERIFPHTSKCLAD